MLQLVSGASHPIAAHPWKSLSLLFSIPSGQQWHLSPPLSGADHTNAGPQPLMHCVLQPFIIHWTHPGVSMSVLCWGVQNWTPHCEMCLHRCQAKGKRKTSSLSLLATLMLKKAQHADQLLCCKGKLLTHSTSCSRLSQSFPAKPTSTQATVTWDCSISTAQIHTCFCCASSFLQSHSESQL